MSVIRLGSSSNCVVGYFCKIYSFSLLSIPRVDTDFFWDELKLLARSQKSELVFFGVFPVNTAGICTCPNDIC